MRVSRQIELTLTEWADVYGTLAACGNATGQPKLVKLANKIKRQYKDVCVHDIQPSSACYLCKCQKVLEGR